MNSDNVRKAIIKEMDDFLGNWGSMHYVQIGATIEEIINRQFKNLDGEK